ncbi:MAG: amidohydrolase family protein [Deltaproteobacteria bacterium]|nr:amidohydrolase family protein [Deltaproteobacteria bacterium]
MFIDAHTHAYQPQDLPVMTSRLQVLDAVLPDDSPHKWRLYHGGLLEDLVAAMDVAEVDQAVLLPLTSRPARVSDLNRWAARAAATEPRIIPFGTLHPEGDWACDLAELARLGIKGVKLHPFTQRFELSHPAVGPLLAAVAERGLPLLLDTLETGRLVRAKPHLHWLEQVIGVTGVRTRDVVRLAREHPTLTIIAAHMGSLYGWDRVQPLMELDNVFFDLAYVAGLLPDEQVVSLVRQKGVARVIYGSDAPWRDMAAFRTWFEGLGFSPAEQEALAAGNLLGLLA